MLDHVVVDVEIAKCIGEDGLTWDDTGKVGILVACVWEYNTRRMRVYGDKDVYNLQGRLLRADRISGFNIWNFDFPVIWGISKSNWIGDRGDLSKDVFGSGAVDRVNLKSLLYPKTDDILRRIWRSLSLNPDVFDPRTHGGYSLNAVADCTLGVNKIGNGADAPMWYQNGEIAKLINYCADDVALERDLVDFIDRYGYCQVYRSNKVQRIELPKWILGSPNTDQIVK